MKPRFSIAEESINSLVVGAIPRITEKQLKKAMKDISSGKSAHVVAFNHKDISANEIVEWVKSYDKLGNMAWNKTAVRAALLDNAELKAV